ncbi:MAG: class I SAM-dependent methyltransferase [Thermaurantimonas sp.]|uniref:class I SAM-dependent methyltransferase n=1 Tax=Thermaurantimonas sp. TaxID=2681568 RepID=UPI00391CB817
MWTAYMVDVGRFAYAHRKTDFNDFFNPYRKYEARYLLYNYIIDIERLDKQKVVYLEFGVSKGFSLKHWSERLKNEESRLYGFDTFKGLPEAWGSYKVGDMSAGMKEISTEDARVHLIKGLFQETLASWLIQHDISTYDRRVIHLDADLYSSTLYVLTLIFPYLKVGDILFFDEFNVPLHEFKAFDDFCKAYYTEFELLGAVNNYFQVAMKYKGQKLPEI